MFQTVVIVVGILGHLSSGVPLEDPSTDLKEFFDNRIVGGSEADNGVSPSTVALVAGDTFISFVCGASIIGDDWIMTAAHCITSFINWDGALVRTFHGRVGSNTWHKGIRIDFVCYRIHPEYDQWYIKNDIGLLKTKRKIQFNKKVAPIGLNFECVKGGEKSFVVGWGTERLWGATPDKLQKLYVEILTHKLCEKLIKQAAGGGWAPNIDPKAEICALHPSGAGHGMCHGDSGSALVLKRCGTQAGIVSWGFPCGLGAPDVYVNVCGFKKFIQAVLALGCQCHDYGHDMVDHQLYNTTSRAIE